MAEVAKSTRALAVVKGSGARRRYRNRSFNAGCSTAAPGTGGPLLREYLLPAPPRLLPMPPFGAVTEKGLRLEMEDAVVIKPSLCSPIINRGRPLHYFGVFDGHGGSHFAIMCKERLHAVLEEELMSLRGVSEEQMEDESVLKDIWRNAISRVFSRTEQEALRTCVCGSVGFRFNCDPLATEFCGTTAVVVVLTADHIVVGNCGDSRAVLYRRKNVVPLTFDHKPDRADELARIKASGGKVINADVARVDGILAMSRAIGDKYLKPLVISEPEVTFTKRDEEDEFLILASDGMWDLIQSSTAGGVVREFLKDTVTNDDAQPSDEASISASIAAAGLLCRLALARRSADNISVVVVDLKRI